MDNSKRTKITFIVFLILTIIDLFAVDPIPFIDEFLLIVGDALLAAKSFKKLN